MANTQETISGSVDAIIFQNNENGYTICDIETNDGQFVTATGIMPYLAKADQVTFTGYFINHPSYGRQFKVEYFEKELPKKENDIYKYLSSGVIKGVGPKTAQKIIDEFGEDTFDVLENHPDWLMTIPGITQKKAANISLGFKEASGARNVMMFCKNYFGPAISTRIYKQWGGNAIEIIKENPYRLCSEFEGISFTKADTIAETLGLPKDSDDRISGGILYDLYLEAIKKSNTCIMKETLIKDASKLLNVDDEKIADILESLIRLHLVIQISSEGDTLIALPDYYNAEKFIAKKLTRLNKLVPRLSKNDIISTIQYIEDMSNMTYADKQREAIVTALNEGVMIITGGPGTGKTTVIKALLTIFNTFDLKVALAAPTGRAAKRISESTQAEAKTIHRLLEMEYDSKEKAKFSRNESFPLDEDVFIIDESSMIDVLLLEALLKAIKPYSRIIFIGDCDQLPSVGAGNVFADLINSKAFKTIELTDIFRQAENSLIVYNAHQINEGNYPIVDNKCTDFFFISRENEATISSTIINLITERLPKAYGNNIKDKIQVITPSHKGNSGTIILNSLLQEALNPKQSNKKEKKHRDVVFRVGDKVMQTKNNYSIEWKKDFGEGTGIFNGDIGTILDINDEDNYFTINFDDKIVEYDFEFLDELEHAYAITVHKSQGCEYPVVIIPLYQCAPMLLTRNLLYTAVTRASQMVILIGREEILHKMVNNNFHAIRTTELCNQINYER